MFLVENLITNIIPFLIFFQKKLLIFTICKELKQTYDNKHYN